MMTTGFVVSPTVTVNAGATVESLPAASDVEQDTCVTPGGNVSVGPSGPDGPAPAQLAATSPSTVSSAAFATGSVHSGVVGV